RFCYQRPGPRDSTRRHMLCEGDRVVITEPAQGYSPGPRELGTVVEIDRKNALLKARLDRGDVATVSLWYLLVSGSGLKPPEERVALGYAVDYFPERFPHNALVLLDQNPWDDGLDIIDMTIKQASLYQLTAVGDVRFYATKYVTWFH